MWIAAIVGIVCQNLKILASKNHIILMYLFIGIIPGTFMIAFMVI